MSHNSSTLLYLASPYSHSDPSMREWRFQEACKAAVWLMGQGFQVFSPIAHSHPIAVEGRLGTAFADYAEFDKRLIRASDVLAVFELAGWKESVGVQAELAYAAELGIRIWYFEKSSSGFAWDNSRGTAGKLAG